MSDDKRKSRLNAEKCKRYRKNMKVRFDLALEVK